LQATYRDDFSIEAYCHQVEACTQIAVNCVEKDKQKRPDILKITEMLNEIEIDVGQVINFICEGIQWIARIANDHTTCTII
jgi:hypothetical protein